MWTQILVGAIAVSLMISIKYVIRRRRVRVIEEAASVLAGRKVSAKEFFTGLEAVRASRVERAKERAETTVSIVRRELRAAERHPDSLEHHLWTYNLNSSLWGLRFSLVEGGGCLKLEDLDFSEEERAEIRRLLPVAVEWAKQQSYRPK